MSHRLPRGRVVMGIAIAVNVLVFVRVAVIHSPYYSYLGPSGADRKYYYAVARSLVIDHDLELANEFAMYPPTSDLEVRERPSVTKFPFGVSLLSLPAFAVTHAVAVGLQGAGVPVATDGYSVAYVMAYALGQMGFALLGMWLLYLVLRRYFDDHVAAAGTLMAWFGTTALHFSAVDLMMSHAAALFSTAWCGFEAFTLRESSERLSKWLRLGASCALVLLVRYQDAVFLVVPLAAALTVLSTSASPRTIRACVLGSVCAALGAAALLGPQLVIWRIRSGEWIVNSYGQEATNFNWSQPHLLDVLYRDPMHGLLVWMPALTVGIVGCFALAARRRDPVVLAAGLAWVMHLYVICAWWGWEGITQRAISDVLLPIALGFGAALTLARGRWRLAVGAAAVALIAWNVPFVAAVDVPRITAPVFSGWLEGLRQLL